MKKSNLILFAAVIIIASCKKENNSSTQNANAISESVQACNATLADAENIQIFPATNAWNTDISAMPVDSNSKKIIANFSSSPIHADFGSGLWDNAPIGIPYVVVCGSQTKYNVVF